MKNIVLLTITLLLVSVYSYASWVSGGGGAGGGPETDPLALHKDGSVLPTANFDWNAKNLANIGDLSFDWVNSDWDVKEISLFGQDQMHVQSKDTGTSAFIMLSSFDRDGTDDVGFSILPAASDADQGNFFYKASDTAYFLNTNTQDLYIGAGGYGVKDMLFDGTNITSNMDFLSGGAFDIGSAAAKWVDGHFSGTITVDTDVSVNGNSVDTHLTSTANPHTVTHTQVGSATAQWNASDLQGVDIEAFAPGIGEDEYVLTYDHDDTRFELKVVAGGGGTDLTGTQTDNRLTRGNGTDTVQDSGITVDDSDNVSGVTSLSVDTTAQAWKMYEFATDVDYLTFENTDSTKHSYVNIRTARTAAETFRSTGLRIYPQNDNSSTYGQLRFTATLPTTLELVSSGDIFLNPNNASGDVFIKGDIRSDSTDTKDLGISGNNWRDLYLSGKIKSSAVNSDSSDNVTLGDGGLAQAATDGFVYIPTVADAPSGSATAKSGFVPMAWDATNNDLCVYDDAQWRCVTFD